MNSDLYAAWAPSYPPVAHNELMRVEQDAVLELVPPVAGLRVLDAGCGSGRYRRLLSERGAREIVCVDVSLAMLHQLSPGTRRIRADLGALPLASDSIDVIVCGLALPDIRDLASVFNECRRVLTSRGVVICSTLHPRGAALGWKRTFDTPQGQGELPACWHSQTDLRDAFAHACLSVDAWLEPSLDPSDSRAPVALVMRAYRSSRGVFSGLGRSLRE
jgi:malonyl-CoA O-methyltransferase